MNLMQRKSIGCVWVVLCLCCFVFSYPVSCESSDLVISSLYNDLRYPGKLTPESDVGSEYTVIYGEIGKRPVYVELVANSIAPAQALSLANSFKPFFDFRNARPKDTYRIFVDHENNLKKFIYKNNPLDYFMATKNPQGDYSIRKENVLLDKEIIAREFVLESSLYEAMTSQGETGSLVSALTDIFSWDIDFYLYPRKGDRIRILFERYTKDGDLLKYGNILAVQYFGYRGTHSAFLSEDDNIGTYYDENGQNLRKMFLRIPVKFGTRTSSFSPRRFHPVFKKYKSHTGNDYGARTGTPIFATAGGNVIFSGVKGGYGKLVIVRHPNGYQTYYAHCSKLLVKKGNVVKQGQVIAKVGKTGTATGPHVHYEIRQKGRPINPGSVKSESADPIQPEMLGQHQEKVSSLLSMMETMISDERKYSIAPESDAASSPLAQLQEPEPRVSIASEILHLTDS